MPKVKIICLILATVLASVGTILVITNLGGGEIPPLDAPIEDINTYLDKPVDGTPSDVEDVRENLFIAHKTLLLKEAFYGISEGATTSFGIKQDVSNLRYVVGEFGHKNAFKQMVTKGVVPNAYQLYMWDNNYLYRGFDKVNSLNSVNWKNTANKLEKSDFEDRFGHRSDKLTAYILNYDTVLSGKLEKFEDGIYTYRFELDTTAATSYMRKEMVTNGNLSGYPTFAKAEIVVSMDEEWNVKTLTTDCEYTAKTMGITARCTEDITETFYEYDGDLPEKDFFEQFFDADYSGVDQEKTALDVLLDMFSPYLNGEDLQVALECNAGSSKLVDALISVRGLDISDLSKLSVAVQLNNALTVNYEHGDGAIFIKYQDFQGSTTVDGIMGFVQTLMPLLGDGAELSLDDIDLDALLAALTYNLSEDESVCTVSLPISLGGVNIDANLYGNLNEDGGYSFAYATIAVGSVEVTITPTQWTVPERSGAYPEILGLTDLIQNGKIALNAQLALALDGVDYNVNAQAQIDLATKNVALTAELGNNGSVSIVLADKIAYVQYGEVKVKLDTTNVESLLELIEKYFGVTVSAQIPDISVGDILGALGQIKAISSTDGGVSFSLALGEIVCNVNLVAQANRWQLDSIEVNVKGINATVVGSDNYADVTAPADKDAYADVTELIETFAEPIVNLINGNSFGASFELNLTVGAKAFLIKGSVAFDQRNTLSVTATVYDGNVGIIDANVVYANDTVYLSLNGIKVAFAVGGNSSEGSFADAIAKLLENEQIVALLSDCKELGELVDKLVDIIGTVSDFDLTQLLNVNFAEVITAFSFNNGKLALSLDGSALGFDGIALDITLANVDGNLALNIDGLQIANVSLALSTTLTSEVETIAIPNVSDYILNLHGSVIIDSIALDLHLTADLINFDIWATVQIDNQVIYLRFVDGVVYLSYSNVAIKLDTTNLGAIVDKFGELFAVNTMSIGNFDINTILSALSFDLTGAEPRITLAIAGIEASVNFDNIDGVLNFNNITASFGDGKVDATFELNGQQADQLDTDGEFVDGNALIESAIDTVVSYINADGVTVQFTADITVNGKAYAVDVTIKYHGGLYATLTLTDDEGAVVNAEIYLVDGTLYFDVNGIRQAIKLNMQQTYALEGNTLQQLIAQINDLIAELDNETLNEIFESLEQLSEKLAKANFADFISLFRYEDGQLTIGVDLSQLDMEGFTVNVGFGDTLTLNVDGLKFNSTEISLAANAVNHSEKITAPLLDSYVNEFRVSVGSFTAYVKLDLYHGTILGKAELLDGTVNFKYVDGAIYVKYGNVGVVLKLSEIDTLIETISQFVALPDISLGDTDIIDTVKSLLSKVQFAKHSTDNGYCLTVDVDDVSVTVNFARANGKATLLNVTVAAGEFNVEVETVEGVQYTDINTNGYFVNACELVSSFADGIASIVNAEGYAINVDGNVTLGSNVYTLNAEVQFFDGNVQVNFKLSLGKAKMLDGQLWIVDRILYVDIGDVKLAVRLGEKTESPDLTLEDIKQTLTQLIGYNRYLDELIELVLNTVDTDVKDIKLSELIAQFTLTNGQLAIGINGKQFELSQFEVVAKATDNGLQFALSNLSHKDIVTNLSGSVSAFTGKITVPNNDYTTNLKVTIDEHNTLYANIDLLGKVIKLQLVSVSDKGKTTKLDILYSLTDNIIKITNGQKLYISADINNIVDIVKEIDDIVNEFAGAEAGDALSGLASMSNVDLKAIVNTLRISSSGSKAEMSLSALGINVTATFAYGSLSSVVIPIADGLTLNVTTECASANYAEFPANAKYVRIDEVFNDYFYGASDDEMGAIDTLIHTNSWLFEFNADSEITVTGDDGAATKYQIAKGSFFAFYYNKTDTEGFKLRAKVTVNKWASDRWNEFIILDVAYIDGRIYVNYDSNSSNSNTLKATVSLEAIKDCINLIPAMYKVVPQLEDVVNNLKQAMSDAQGSISLGNLASLFNEVTYSDDKVFTLALNSGIIDGLGEIYLSAQQYGTDGLQLNELRLSYNTISVQLNNLVVTASPSKDNADGSKSFDYVDDYILSYFNVNGDINSHMNFDTIRELLAGFIITADNVDEDGNRSFAIEGTVNANMIGLAKVDIQIYINVDIDKDNNVYLALKLHRESATGLAGGLAYDDEGGDSYLLLNSKTQTVSLARNSIQKQKWCSKCGGWSCSNTVLHTIYRSNKKVSDLEYTGSMSYLVEDMALTDFAADTTTMVNYILELVNFSSTIEKPIKEAIGKENSNVYGIEDILKSYNYSFDESKSQGTFALVADLSPIDSALGEVSVNILHKGNFDDAYYDEESKSFHDGGVALTQINGNATMIKVMDATFTLYLVEPTSGLAYKYVTNHNYVW